MVNSIPDLKGQTKAEAMKILESLGISFRLTKEDGRVVGVCTRDYDDYDTSRINLEIEDGIVVECHKG